MAGGGEGGGGEHKGKQAEEAPVLCTRVKGVEVGKNVGK